MKSPGSQEINTLATLFAEARYDDALALAQTITQRFPQHGFGWNALGMVLLQMGRSADALAPMQKAATLASGNSDAHYNLGLTYQALGRIDEAEASYRRALQIKPGDAEVHYNLSLVLRSMGRLDDAVVSCRQAIQFRPNYAEAYFNLGGVLQTQGKMEEAAQNYAQALAFKPDYAEARWSLAMISIPLVADNQEQIEACRENSLREHAELNAWFDVTRTKLGHNAVGIDHPFYLAYQEENNRDMLARHGALCVRLMQHWQERQTFSFPHIAAGGVVRVGIVSAHIRSQSVWDAFVKGWFQHLDRARFELHVFHIGSRQDHETAWAKSRSASFEQGSRSLKQWVEAIMAKHVDVLIYPEIGMDPMTLKLASLRLAPTQIAAWGHPETSGLPTMDYYLSAEYLEPADAQNNYTERLICMPHLGCHYHAEPTARLAPDFVALGIATGVPLLLCPGVPFKYAPQHDHVLVEIARKLGRCQLVFFTYANHALSAKLRRRLSAAFAQAGMKFDDYSVFIPWQEKAAFYGLMEQADVFLDTIGFSGFNTAIQAVECGLPVVTREGRFMRGRLASGILRRMGVTELIVDTDEAYVDLAVRLARDAEYRHDIRLRIASARSILFDDITPVRALEDFLLRVVKR